MSENPYWQTANKQAKAIQSVLDLHEREYDSEDVNISWCSHCADLCDGEKWEDIEWPCETVRLLSVDMTPDE